MNDATDNGAPPDRIQLHDPGLANERTSLAWTRSGLSLAAIAALIARAATQSHEYAIGYPCVVLLLVGAVMTWRHGSFVYVDNRRAVASSEPVARPTPLKLLCALTITSGAVALAITLISS